MSAGPLPPPPDSASHTDNFDLVRFIAATLVVYGHSFALTGTEVPSALGSAISTLSVKVFFVLSGYLVSGSWVSDPSPHRYALRRSLRIVPGLAVLILVTAYIVGPLITSLSWSGYFASPLVVGYLKNVLLYPVYSLPGLFTTNTFPNAVNGSLWSLPVEYGMYIVVPFLLWTGRNANMRAVLGAIALCGAAVGYNHFWTPANRIIVYGNDLRDIFEVCPYFLLGAAWRMAVPRHLLNLQVSALMLALTATVPRDAVYYDLALYIVLPYAVLSFGLAKPALFSHFGRHGDFSYGIYLYGFLVQQCLAQVLPLTGHPVRLFALSWPVTAGLAALSWHFVEKPCLRFKPGRRRNLAPADAMAPKGGARA